MKALWRKYAARIDAMAERERVMVFIAAVVVVLYVIDAFFIEPPVARARALAAQAVQQRAMLSELEPRIKMIEKQLANPDAENFAKRDDIRRQIEHIDETLRGMQQNLVGAQNMKALLQDMLARNPRLQLVSLRTLPVTPLVEKRDKPSAAAGAVNGAQAAAETAVYKHGVQITIRGSYADLYDYLRRLENLSWHMFWSRANLDAESYPRLVLTITVYTLSLDQAWLVV